MSFRASQAALALLCLACLASLAPSVWADDFSEFRIPPNRALLWTMGLGGAAFKFDSNSPIGAGENGYLSGSASTQAFWLSDSDPAFTSLSGSGQLSGNRRGGAFHSLFTTPFQTMATTGENHDRAALEGWSLSFTHRRYFGEGPLAATLSGSGNGLYQQQWSAVEREDLLQAPGGSVYRDHDERSLEQWLYDHGVTAGAGVGVGRVRNATGIYDAYVLEQRLTESGALSRPLSPAARRRLAELMYVRGTVSSVRDRPGRGIWKELERILAEDGALAGDHLDAYSVLRAAEPHLGTGGISPDGIPSSPVSRLSGAFVGVRIEDSHTHTVGRRDEDVFQRQTIDDTLFAESRIHVADRSNEHNDGVRGGVEAEYHRPLGPRWQIDASSLVLVPLRKEDSSLGVSSLARATWLVADRWIASTSFTQGWFDANRLRGSSDGDQIFWSTSANVSYYVEDHLTLGLSAGTSQNRREVDPVSFFPSGSVFSRDEFVSLGLTYRFSGWLDVPGMFPVAMR